MFSPFAGTLVLQPTPLCNMRCTYCYLANLSDRSRMAPDIPRKLASELAAYPLGHPVEVRWHAGEPLTVGVDHFSSLLEPFEPLRRAGRLRHTLQTNGTLIDDAWCELFRRHAVGVGVSLDGPRWANGERRTLSGAQTFDRAMAGIDRLRSHHLPLSVIAVVTSANIPEIVDRASEYFDFFRSIDAREIGFNLEEQEGKHSVDPIAPARVRAFWNAVFDAWVAADCTPRIRDFQRVLSFAAASLEGSTEVRPVDPMPTVTWDGNVVLLSPELAGCRDERHGDFTVGNVRDGALTALIERGLEQPYVREFCEGSERCREQCRYFDYCRGGQASNRYFEHGDFVTNETEFCRSSRQAPFDVLVGLIQSSTHDVHVQEPQ